MLTARASTGDKVRGLNAGADDYLVKPFDMAELVAIPRQRCTLARPAFARVEMAAIPGYTALTGERDGIGQHCSEAGGAGGVDDEGDRSRRTG